MSKYIFLLLCCYFCQSAIAHKPYNELLVNNVNLAHYPEKITKQQPGVEVTIGDLHGNSLKLLNFLIRNDVLRITENDYKLFSNIYSKQPDQLTVKDLGLFRAIINTADINRQHKIRFLGDDLCDRGMNDFFSLYIYQKLDSASVPFDIVLSNHGNFFLSAYERPEQSFSYNPYGKGRREDVVQSMLNMGKLIDKGLIDKQDVLNIIQNHYLRHLVLPGYTFNKSKNEVTIYSHAPIDLAVLAELAKDLNTTFNDADSNELSKSFDAINEQIHQWIMSNSFTAHYQQLNESHQKSDSPSPLKQILWNRDYTILKRDHHPENKSYTLNYVHGHDSMANVFDLDNLFGKKPGVNEGPYAVHVTHS